MAIGSGLGAQWGHAAQSVYGTAVAVTSFPRVSKWEIKKTAQRAQGKGIAAGGFGPLGSMFVEATQAGEASLDLEVVQKGMGLLLKHLMGSSTSAAQGGTAAYLQTHTLADLTGLHLTCQGGRPTRAGTAVPITATGCKITKAEFACKMGELLSGSFSFDAQKVDNTTALAAASYVASAPFHSGIMALKIGTYGAEAAVTGVREVSVSFERAMDTEDYTAGASGLKAEPVINDYAKISGSITADWLAKATFEDLALTPTSKSLVWEFVDTTAIATTYYPTFRVTVPGVFFNVNTQSVDGPKELTQSWAWEWRYDGTNLPKIEYLTADTTIV